MLTKKCLYCGRSFQAKRITKKFCKPAHRLAHFKDQHHPLRGTEAAAARKAAWLDRQQYGKTKKATIRALAERGLGFDGAEKYSADQDQDPKKPYDVRWIRKYARSPKQSGEWGTMPASERLRRLESARKDVWEGKKSGEPPFPLYITDKGLLRWARRVAIGTWAQRVRLSGWTGLTHLLMNTPMGPSAQNILMERQLEYLLAEKERWTLDMPSPRAKQKVAEVIRQAATDLGKLLRQERNRMLEQQLLNETAKVNEATERVDRAFRVTEKEWLDLKARTATMSRLILERFPEGDRTFAEFPEVENTVAGLRATARAMLSAVSGEREAA